MTVLTASLRSAAVLLAVFTVLVLPARAQSNPHFIIRIDGETQAFVPGDTTQQGVPKPRAYITDGYFNLNFWIASKYESRQLSIYGMDATKLDATRFDSTEIRAVELRQGNDRCHGQGGHHGVALEIHTLGETWEPMTGTVEGTFECDGREVYVRVEFWTHRPGAKGQGSPHFAMRIDGKEHVFVPKEMIEDGIPVANAGIRGYIYRPGGEFSVGFSTDLDSTYQWLFIGGMDATKLDVARFDSTEIKLIRYSAGDWSCYLGGTPHGVQLEIDTLGEEVGEPMTGKVWGWFPCDGRRISFRAEFWARRPGWIWIGNNPVRND